MTALPSLVLFPFSLGSYFFYVFPLELLAATALFASADRPPRFVLGTVIVFYLLFAVMRVTPAFIHGTGGSYPLDIQPKRLTLQRAGGLRVNPRDADMYEALIPLVQSHANGRFIYATPDCPEVYFLSGHQNPTRTLYDFLDDPVGRTERILGTLESHDINLVVINNAPGYSEPIEPSLRRAFEERYPHSAEIAYFQVRWRE